MNDSDQRIREMLLKTTTATVSGLLLHRGIGQVTMEGIKPVTLAAGARIAGRARTVRYVPGREDKPWADQPQARLYADIIDAFQAGDVLVLDARGEIGAGVIGDVLATRAKLRKASGIVADGAVRDFTALRQVGLPIFAKATHPAPHWRKLQVIDAGAPVGCGGVVVYEGDWVLGDDEAVVVIPQEIAAEIASEAVEFELHDEYSRKLVERGFPVSAAYPPNKALEDAYAEYKSSGNLPETATET